jgi:uncharacterized protein (TIGR02246 family)
VSEGPGLTLEDRAEIADLYVRYAFAFDDNKAEACAALYTQDGSFTVGVSSPVVGRDALADMVRASAARPPGGRHLLSGVLVEPSADGASGSAYVQVVRVEESALRLVAFGRYQDELARTEDGWRFRARRFSPFTGAQLSGAILAAPDGR